MDSKGEKKGSRKEEKRYGENIKDSKGEERKKERYGEKVKG